MAKTQYGNLLTQKTTYNELVDLNTDKVSTGSLIFDIFLEGGYTPGTFRFYAPSEHGKSAQMLTWAREWLKKYGDKAEIHIFDAEGRITKSKIDASGIQDCEYFRMNGKEDDTVQIYTYNIYDDIAQFIYDRVIENNGLSEKERKRFFFGIDSLDMLITSDNMKKSFGDAEKIGAAQTVSALLAKKVGVGLYKRGHHLHILSQIRANINTHNPNSPTTKVSGGNAMLHMANLTGEIQKDWSEMYIYENPQGKSLKEKGNIIGKYHTIKMLKTPNEKTHQVIRIPIKYKHGIWWEKEIVELVLAFEIVTATTSWFTLNEDWQKRISDDITASKRANYIGEKRAAIETKDKEAIAKELKKIKEDAAKIVFTCEGRWHGQEGLFRYIEANRDVAAWMDTELRKVLLGAEIGTRVEEGQETDIETLLD